MEKESIVHSFDGKNVQGASSHKTKNTSMKKKSFLIFLSVIIFGLITGFLISLSTKTSVVTVTSDTDISNLPKGTVFGSDAKAFNNDAEGVLREGGIDGEGSYHLERPGGASQNVYLTSSVLDLSQLVGRKIKVWGQTNAAQKAGWLMDVGRAEIIK
ncbi:MAG TPA: hypothetical protein PKA38_01980 [Candidatus Levybacteria bacterium]|nr:hypothetical protein [Candidatus Levybacteria bacterium]